jgi:hypothetical protein
VILELVTELIPELILELIPELVAELVPEIVAAICWASTWFKQRPIAAMHHVFMQSAAKAFFLIVLVLVKKDKLLIKWFTQRQWKFNHTEPNSTNTQPHK